MIQRTLICLLFVVNINNAANSQNIKYARTIIDSLCSKKYLGRGYSFKGDSLAAAFIVSEITKSDSIKPFNKSFYQAFSFPVNTFNGAMQIRINNTTLKPGIDYIPTPYSGSIKGKFKLKTITGLQLNNATYLNQDFSKYIIVIDTSCLSNKALIDKTKLLISKNSLSAKGYIIPQSKLTFGISQTAAKHVVIELNTEKFKLISEAKKITIHIENTHLSNYTSYNIAGYLPGESDSIVVLTAHYDHLGTLGNETYFPGAHDNASGVAMVLDKMLHEANKNQKPKYTLAFIFFSGEEAGLLGSNYFVNNPLFPLSNIKFLINFDLLGSGEQGITVVNSSIFESEYQTLKQINDENKYVTEIKRRGAAANSDHYYFYTKGVKCFYIYTLGSYKEYHNIHDNPQNIPLNTYEPIFQLITDFINRL